MVNIRTKGATAEREVADALNAVINKVRSELGFQPIAAPQVKRNLMQSMEGGCDLVGTFEWAIEVKRHETPSVNTWWKQCAASAKTLRKCPVLVYRASRSPWKVCLPLMATAGGMLHEVGRGEITWEAFLGLFEQAARLELAPQLQQLATSPLAQITKMDHIG